MAEGESPISRVRRAGACRHDGYHSGIGVYVRDLQLLRYVLVCDDCGAETKEISAVEYVPSPAFSRASR
jgi:hypothetical protein